MGGRGAMTARHVNQEKPKSSFHFYFFSQPSVAFREAGTNRVERINGGTQWTFFFISVIVNSERDSVQFPSFTLRFGVTSGMIFTNVSMHSSSTWRSQALPAFNTDTSSLDIFLTWTAGGRRFETGAERRWRCWCKASLFRFRCCAQLHFLVREESQMAQRATFTEVYFALKRPGNMWVRGHSKFQVGIPKNKHFHFR